MLLRPLKINSLVPHIWMIISCMHQHVYLMFWLSEMRKLLLILTLLTFGNTCQDLSFDNNVLKYSINIMQPCRCFIASTSQSNINIFLAETRYAGIQQCYRSTVFIVAFVTSWSAGSFTDSCFLINFMNNTIIYIIKYAHAHIDDCDVNRVYGFCCCCCLPLSTLEPNYRA